MNYRVAVRVFAINQFDPIIAPEVVFNLAVLPDRGLMLTATKSARVGRFAEQPPKLIPRCIQPDWSIARHALILPRMNCLICGLTQIVLAAQTIAISAGTSAF